MVFCKMFVWAVRTVLRGRVSTQEFCYFLPRNKVIGALALSAESLANSLLAALATLSYAYFQAQSQRDVVEASSRHSNRVFLGRPRCRGTELFSRTIVNLIMEYILQRTQSLLNLLLRIQIISAPSDSLVRGRKLIQENKHTEASRFSNAHAASGE